MDRVSCQVEYRGLVWRCSQYKTRKENLTGAWQNLLRYCGDNLIAIPASLNDFISGGGKVSYYKSF